MKINLVVWGLGKHSVNKVINVIKKTKEIKLYGLYTRNQKVLKEQSKKYKCKIWKNSASMLKDEKIDAVYLATPIGLHFKYGKKILLHGKHLWSEKSLACNYQEVNNLVKIAKKNKLAVCEAFMYLYHPIFKKLKELLKKKTIGDIYFVNFNFFCPHLKKTNWRYKKKLGGGALLDLGCYPISAYLNLFNLNLKVFFSHLNKELPFKVDTSGLIFLKNKNLLFKLSWGLGFEYENNCRIFGKKGSIDATPFFSKPFERQSKIRIYKKNSVKEIKIEKSNHFVEMLDSFSNIIRDEKKIKDQYKICLNQSKLIENVRK